MQIVAHEGEEARGRAAVMALLRKTGDSISAAGAVQYTVLTVDCQAIEKVSICFLELFREIYCLKPRLRRSGLSFAIAKGCSGQLVEFCTPAPFFISRHSSLFSEANLPCFDVKSQLPSPLGMQFEQSKRFNNILVWTALYPKNERIQPLFYLLKGSGPKNRLRKQAEIRGAFQGL